MFDADRTLGSHRWHVVRLHPGSKTEVVLLSSRFFCLTTHWCKFTVLCAQDDCELCETLPSRGLFYVAVFCAGQTRMLELGSQSASHFEQHCKLLYGGMKPGLVLELSRRGAKTPVFSEVLRFQENASAISHLNLAAHVMALYKFPPPNPEESLEKYEARIRAMVQLRNHRLAAQLSASKQS